jgi:hypothetical protein
MQVAVHMSVAVSPLMYYMTVKYDTFITELITIPLSLLKNITWLALLQHSFDYRVPPSRKSRLNHYLTTLTFKTVICLIGTLSYDTSRSVQGSPCSIEMGSIKQQLRHIQVCFSFAFPFSP